MSTRDDSGVQTHRLKTWKPYFEATLQGWKTFELRKRDRDFGVGDTLILLETEVGGAPYTGRDLTVYVTYMLSGESLGLRDWCVLGISREPEAGAHEPDPEDTSICRYCYGNFFISRKREARR